MLKQASILIAAATIALVSCASQSEIKARQDANTGMDQATTYQDSDEHRKANDNIGSGPLGSSTNPIKVDGIEGAKAYLAKLRGPNGQVITYTESGDAGVGPFGSLMYLFELQYPTPQGPVSVQLFFDTDFSGHAEPKAASGFRWQ